MDEHAHSFHPIADTELPEPAPNETMLVVGQATSPTTTVARYRVAQHLSTTAASSFHCITPRSNHSRASSGDTPEQWYSHNQEQQTSFSTFDASRPSSPALHIVADSQPSGQDYRDFVEKYGAFIRQKQEKPLVVAVDNVHKLNAWLPRLLDTFNDVDTPIAVVIAATPALLDIMREPYSYASSVCYTAGVRVNAVATATLEASSKRFLSYETTAPRAVLKHRGAATEQCYELVDAYTSFSLCQSLY